MNRDLGFEGITLAFIGFLVIGFMISLLVSMVVATEYEKHPDYTNSEIFAQGRMEKNTDCYGMTIVKIGGRVVDAPVTIPLSGSWENVKLSDLRTDRDFTVYRKYFWLLGNFYTIR